MTADDLALRVAQREARQGGGRISFEDANLVIEALAGLGYTFEPPGTRPGRYHESDEVQHSMAMCLSRKTGMHVRSVYVILNGIADLGLRIREPDTHPSGARRTIAYAFETVKQTARNIYPT